ncbi:C39 family peptidase [Crocosphaera chwakensis]|uniref:Lysozyme, putative n=1 Tax=Crocosphaera chwakensis CCY0110 TaxID=391612 RepID=A3IWZ0_9CHRO|nr:C39 family peptidase [Crocosphaera chwakensis]EAZ88989.1 lysozyme, putative [Crocosphaera chwakensis CCY0110]
MRKHEATRGEKAQQCKEASETSSSTKWLDVVHSKDEAVDIPLKDWLEINQDWIKQQSGGTRLLEKAFNVALSPTPLIEPDIVERNGDKIGILRGRKDVETLKEEAKSGSVGTQLLRRKRSSKSDLLRKNTNWKTVPSGTKIEATHLTYLKRYTLSALDLQDDQKVEVPVGKDYYVRQYAPTADGHCLVELDYESGVWYIWPSHWHLPWEDQNKDNSQELSSSTSAVIAKKTTTDIVTRQQAKSVYGRTLTDQQFNDLNDCLRRFEINTVPRVRHFLSQTAHESGGLKWMKEIWGPTSAQRSYDPPHRKAKELGNTNMGDGKKYRGGGVIQLTGKYNYQKFANFIDDPKVMQGADYVGSIYPFSSAGFWWKNNNMNALCDAGGTVKQVTRKVNGGYNGLSDRQRYYDKADQIIKSIPTPSPDEKVEPIDNLPVPIIDPLAKDYNNPEAVKRQIDRLSKYLSPGKTLNLDVKTNYFSQRDNYTQPHRTCNSSSNAMYLDWLLRVTGKPGLGGDNNYLQKVLAKGDTIYHGIHTQIIKQYGFNTKWNTDRDLPFIHDLIKAGFPVPVNLLHRGTISAPTGGHVIMLIGYKNDSWIAHDPYGTLESNYTVHNGAYSRISEREFKARWQGGYRMLA